MIMGMPRSAFRYTSGEPKTYARDDLDNPAQRQFCPDMPVNCIDKQPFHYMPEGITVFERFPG